MTERPILFSGPMVRAIIDGRKTQTRRVVKPQPTYVNSLGIPFWPDSKGPVDYRLCPYGQPGDRLWVRETWCEASPEHRDDSGVRQAFYKANSTSSDGEEIRQEYIRLGHDYKWKPSIFMPRWASRITLEVTGVRVERLQDISADDAVAEGVERKEMTDGRTVYAAGEGNWSMSPRDSYRSLWESINGAGSWDANPWVWVIEFKHIHP